MPSFLANGLSVVSANVGVSSVYREVCDNKLEPYSPDIEVSSLIDTGASISIVDINLLKKLRIHEKDSSFIQGFNGSSTEYPTFDVWLKVISRTGHLLVEIRDLRVAGANLGDYGYNAILGMDILKTFTLRFLHTSNFVDMHPTDLIDGAGI